MHVQPQPQTTDIHSCHSHKDGTLRQPTCCFVLAGTARPLYWPGGCGCCTNMHTPITYTYTQPNTHTHSHFGKDVPVCCFVLAGNARPLYWSGGNNWCSTQHPLASPLSTSRPLKCARSTVMSALCTVYSCAHKKRAFRKRMCVCCLLK